MPETFDVAVIGGGIVGLSTAYAFSKKWPDRTIAVVEKEAQLMAHQSSRNSGVIHSGVYYAPGSLKARFCREGRRRLLDFCEREDIPHELCGKIIVAATEEERPRLHSIYQRGQRNGIACTLIGAERLRELEPHAVGVEAIHVPGAGIVDYASVGRRLAAILQERGHQIRTGAEVRDLSKGNSTVAVHTTSGTVHAGLVVNCAGLYADQLARMCGEDPNMAIIPFRGEYYELKPQARRYCRTLIYPTPDPAFPFLGVHFTRRIDGRVDCGPSAVLAFAREGYRLTSIRPGELMQTLIYPGFVRLSMRHFRRGMIELGRSLSKQLYLRAARRLVPAVQADDLVPGRSGVRAQAVTRQGQMVDDFVILESERVVHVCNAPSPAATASLSIGEYVADRASRHIE